MKQPHFFKAASRLGIRTFPNGTNSTNLGVEDAPDAILSTDFSSQFAQARIDSFRFPSPDTVTKDEYPHVLVEQTTRFMTFINDSLKENEQQIVVGGDHIVSLPSVLAVIHRIKNTNILGYIHIDSHGDINHFSTSPTGNFHGIYLRPLTDTCGTPEIDALIPIKLPAPNLMMIGNLDLDPEEKDYIKSSGIRTINLTELRESTTTILDEITSFTKQFTYLHVSLDIDVLDQSIAPATGIPASDGFLLPDILPILKICAQHPHLSFDISEINPKKPGGELTVETAQKILLEILK